MLPCCPQIEIKSLVKIFKITKFDFCSYINSSLNPGFVFVGYFKIIVVQSIFQNRIQKLCYSKYVYSFHFSFALPETSTPSTFALLFHCSLTTYKPSMLQQHPFIMLQVSVDQESGHRLTRSYSRASQGYRQVVTRLCSHLDICSWRNLLPSSLRSGRTHFPTAV